MTAEGESYLLWERGADGVVRYRRENEEEGRSFKREDQSPGVDQCVFIIDGLAECRSESDLQVYFMYLREGEADGQVLDGGRIRVRVGGARFVYMLKCTCYKTKRPMMVSTDWPSNPELRIPSLWVRMSIATKREAHASQPVYFGA